MVTEGQIKKNKKLGFVGANQARYEAWDEMVNIAQNCQVGLSKYWRFDSLT
jgi:hypothetical protein